MLEFIYSPFTVHGCHLGPRLSDRVKAADGVEVLHAIESAHYVDHVTKRCRAVIGSWTC